MRVEPEAEAAEPSGRPSFSPLRALPAVPQYRSFALVNVVLVLLSCGFISLVFAAFARRDFSRPSILQRYL